MGSVLGNLSPCLGCLQQTGTERGHHLQRLRCMKEHGPWRGKMICNIGVQDTSGKGTGAKVEKVGRKRMGRVLCVRAKGFSMSV